MEEFKCRMCGKCCTNWKVGKEGASLFSWEANRYVKKAKEKGINLKIQTGSLVFDEKSKRYIVVDWILKHGNCPFLKEKLCSIYINRAIICKTWPISEIKLRNLLYGKPLKFILGKCAQNSSEKILLEKMSNSDILDRYKSGIIARSQIELIELWIGKQIKKMEEKELIKIGAASEKISKDNIIDFFKLIEESNYMDKEEINSYIYQFDNLLGGKKQFEVFKEKLTKNSETIS